MIFETHAHYDDESFNDDREALIRSLPEKGIGRNIMMMKYLMRIESNY